MIGDNKIAGIFDKKRFYKQYYFVGSIESKNAKISNLNIYIEFKEGEPSEITGIILSDPTNTFNQLDSIAEEYCILRSDLNNDTNQEIYSNKLLIKTISRNSSNVNCQVVAAFTLKEVRITSQLSTNKPHLRIYYDGMKSFRTHEIFTPYKDGSVKVKKNKWRNYLQDFEVANIDFENMYFYENKGQIRTSKFARTIIFTFKSPTSKAKDDCIEFFNNILLMASFVENNDNQWFSYEYLDGKKKITYYKSSKPKLRITDPDDFLITRAFTEKFIEKASPNYGEQKRKGIDLKIPIKYLLTGSISPNINIEYVNYFTALENIKDMYAKSKNPPIEAVCDEKKQKEITQKILPILESSLGEIYNENSYKQKLKGIYRNSFLKILKTLIKEYSVEVKDLFQHNKGDLKLIIDIRNELLHSSSDIDIERLMLNRIRLKALVQRIIMKLLGWERTETVPLPHERKFLEENKIEFL